jgi:hypothetical protein
MHVLFVEPSFPRNQRDFVRALHSVGAQVTAIGEAPVESLDSELKSWLHGYERISTIADAGALYDAVRDVQAREWVDRLEATVEAHIMNVAKVREACDIPGTSTKTAWLCRDKPAMKEALREAGIATAHSIGTSDPEEARAFARQEGYPLILKPRDGAGASGTYKVTSDDELEGAIHETYMDRGASVAVEEFVEGHEAFWDTLSVEGEPVHEFISHYYPGVLEAMRTRWISPQILTTNEVEAETYGEVREMGRAVLRALEVGTSPTHMEWFFGPKGLKFSEIGCRPPGVQVWDIYGAANDLDLYREWAQLIVHGQTEHRASRRFAGGMIALRPDQDGRIVSYEGVEEVQRRYGDWIIDMHFPPAGTPTQGVEGGYMANAWMRLRHPEYEALRAILDDVGRTVQVRAR